MIMLMIGWPLIDVLIYGIQEAKQSITTEVYSNQLAKSHAHVQNMKLVWWISVAKFGSMITLQVYVAETQRLQLGGFIASSIYS